MTLEPGIRGEQSVSVTAANTAKTMGMVKFFKVYLFNDTVNNPDRIVLGNKIA